MGRLSFIIDGKGDFMDNFLIIDGSSLVNRAFYAMPPLSNKKGIQTNAIFGFVRMLDKLIDTYEPQRLAVLFDAKGPNFRKELYKDYKGTRDSFPTELSLQITLLINLLETRGIKTYEEVGLEADDIAGSLANKFKDKFNVLLVTGDRDYLQLVDDKVNVLYTKKGISDTVTYDVAQVVEEYGFGPEKLVDLKALMGDQSDNIPGVPGIGIKTGKSLISEYGSLDGVYENIDKISGKSRKEKLEENKDLAYLSYKLGKIKTDAEMPDEDEFKIKEPDLEELNKIYRSLEFNDFIKEIDIKDDFKPIEYSIITEDELEGFGGEAVSAKLFFRDTYHHAEPIVFAFYDGEKSYIINEPTDYKKICEFLMKQKNLVGFDIKEELYTLFDDPSKSPFKFDVSLGMYLMDPTTDTTKLSQYFAKKHKSIETFDTYMQKNKRIKDVDKLLTDDFYAAVSNTLYILDVLHKELDMELEMLEMDHLMYDVEMPLTIVLADMEKTGVLIDREKLVSLGEEFESNLKSMEEKIYELAGEEFNINSPKQLGEILFDKLGLPPVKKTKTGYSTDKETLDKLSEEHELPRLITEYREDTKLKSTYVDGILDLIDDDGRLRSTFNQTITATGRISSTEPNLQNIPTRTEKGRALRKVFVAKEGAQLYDLDYSQIELRLMAAISGETKMIEGFEGEMDIHRRTASEVFHVPYDDVTALQRSHAKATNFGIIYGISDYGLSRQLDIPRKNAKEYIDKYFEEFPHIKKYMNEIVKDAKDKGYVTTLFKRRRMVPELRSKNFNIRGFGERIALNTPIQGSAADIIKIAMVKVYEYLRENDYKTKLILTIHDELIFEVPDQEFNLIKDDIKDIMTDSFDVGVKLKVEGSRAKSWFDAK